MRLSSEGSFIDAEILLEAERVGARVREFGMRYHPREGGVSTAASARVVVRTLRELLRHRKRRAAETGPVRLIVNADDFGLCEPINRGVIGAFDRGVVTSASLLATGISFEQAVGLARERPNLSLGVHLALTQTRPILAAEMVPSLVDGSGRFLPNWRSFLRRHLWGGTRREELEAEMRAQIESILTAGLSISHVDSHQHLHVLPTILPMVARLAAEYGIGAVRCPVQRRHQAMGRTLSQRIGRRAQAFAVRAACRLAPRVLRMHGLHCADDFRGFTEAGWWTSAGLVSAISDLDAGLVEICCHPGADDGVDAELEWGYHWEQELAALTSGEVRSAVEENHVRLTSYQAGALDVSQSAASGMPPH
jgi:hopanoid biosynthesis associated protein HpnK